MKKIYQILFVLAAIGGLSSCDYLDVVPDNVATIEYAFRNRTAAEKFLFTCYNYRPPIGNLRYDPGMNSCDETWMLYSTDSPYPTSQIARGYQNSNNPYNNYWDGASNGVALWQGIRDCNIFLENIDAVADLDDLEKNRWIAEVKFLKAYYHYFLFKAYGPIPIVDENLPISAGVEEVKVYRESVDDVVDYISGLMLEAVADLPEANEVIEGTEAGRIDKLVALSMNAELLLFAASPLFNGNTDYAGMIDNRGVQLFPQDNDETKWQKAADACKVAIDACHEQNKALYDILDPSIINVPEPFKVQTMYRQTVCDKWNKELIWGNTKYDFTTLTKQSQARLIRLDGENAKNTTTEWAPTLKLAEQYYSSNGVPINEDKEWQENQWYENRYKVRPESSAGDEKYYILEGEKTAYLHYNREPRFYASLGFDKGIYFGNGYYDFETNVKYCDFFNKGLSGRLGTVNYSITGYSAKKMHSYKNAQTTTTVSFEYFPFPIMRLANLYLMYAEALNEANGPTQEAYDYIDLVRARVGLPGVKESWQNFSTHPNKPDTKDGLREIIHQERTIELALESKRFWDIRRWKEIDELNNQPKGWNIYGETNDDFYKVVPVAQIPVKFTVKDYFWPIKESDLTVNNNLVQNYGW